MTSMTGTCSAKGLAKLAAVMANRGRLGDYVLLEEETWEQMHGGVTTKNDASIDTPGINPTSISRGGVPVHR